MATAYKRLGSADLAATTNTTLYTAPASTQTVATVSLCNRNSSAQTVRLALASADTPTTSEWLEYDYSVPANGVLERTGIALDAGKKLVAYAGGTGISAVAYGMEIA
jgi:hypothetical protein